MKKIKLTKRLVKKTRDNAKEVSDALERLLSDFGGNNDK